MMPNLWKLPVIKVYHRKWLSANILQCFQQRRNLSAGDHSSNKLFTHFRNKVKATGPITVAEYMKEVLINPYSGYYMHKDVFGESGDFITSPEISQMFGELIAIWFFDEWSKIGKPQPFQLVEFGPGRGTLADDICRVFSKFNVDKDMFSLHFIEVSPHLREIQKAKLGCAEKFSPRNGVTEKFDEMTNCTNYKYPLTWHYDLSTVPEKFSLFLAHEFFDALPIHKFQKTPDGWREVLIDCVDNSEKIFLQYVLSPGPTAASKIFINPGEERNEIEISPESGVIINQCVKHMVENGGISLIIDYGHLGTKGDTFRAFQKHKLHNPLNDPGHADLTADVDFSYLIKCAGNDAISVGPVTQAAFLKNMAIDIRLEKLLQNASSDQKKCLVSGYNMLIDSEQMGERYKFLALYPAVLKDFLCKYPPAGFS